MCIRTHIHEVCTKCGVRVPGATTTRTTTKCWWSTINACTTMTRKDTEILVVGCSKCDGEEFEYSQAEREKDEREEKWVDDDADKGPFKRPKYHWKNSIPEAVLRKWQGDSFVEEWKEEEKLEKEEEKKVEKRVQLLRWARLAREEREERDRMEGEGWDLMGGRPTDSGEKKKERKGEGEEEG